MPKTTTARVRFREAIATDGIAVAARRCGVSRASIYNYLHGRIPSRSPALAIADAYGIPVEAWPRRVRP